MKTSLMMVVALAAASVLANTPPEITNVRAGQREGTKLVDIYYDAADADGDALKIRVEISDNDGAKYSVPALTFTGDIGEGVMPGANKHIVWDAGTDWDGEYSDQMRVKIYAIDAQGFPGMEWSNEIPPGGFLMGQDGGAEGSGESCHVNIPWSYWLGKYEVSCEQYCDFLNLASSVGYVERAGTVEVRASSSIPLDLVAPQGSVLCAIGDATSIRWNVNKYEPSTSSCAQLPVSVTWYGAIAFARFYGYDLPTEAEWEKAARGPNNDDQDEHLCYPWGNEVSIAYANITPYKGLASIGYYDGDQIPVGPDTINGYGLYDVIGNAVEWTITAETAQMSIGGYPVQESLLDSRHFPYKGDTRVVRGYRGEPIYHRKGALGEKSTLYCLLGYLDSGSSYSSIVIPNYSSTEDPVGFRVVRRLGTGCVKANVVERQNFNEWTIGTYSYPHKNGTWVVGGGVSSWDNVVVAASGIDQSPCVRMTSGSTRLYIPKQNRPISLIRFKVKGISNSYYYVKLHSVFSDGTSLCDSNTISDNGQFPVHTITLSVKPKAEELYLEVSNGDAFLDDVEIITTELQ